MRARAALVWLVALAAPAAAAPDGEVRAAIDAQRYPEARAALDAALRDGGLSKDQLIALYALGGELAAIVDGPEAGEREFRKLLVLDPGHPPPQRQTPVFVEPFARAQRWVAQNGQLAAEAAPPSARPDAPTEIAIQVTSDPLAMVDRARAFAGSGGALAPAAVAGLRVMLPAGRAGEAVDYYVELLDHAGDVVWSLGSAGAPRRLLVGLPAAPARSRRVRPLWAALAGGGAAVLALAGGAIGLDFAAQSEFDGLKSRCGPRCTASDLGTLHLEEGLSIAGYALAGAAAVATVVAAIVVRRAR